MSLIDLACHSKDCAPPPVGKGGSAPKTEWGGGALGTPVTDHASAEEVAAAIYDMDLPHGTRSEVTDVEFDGSTVRVNGHIYDDEDDATVGEFQRTLRLDDGGFVQSVEHDSIYVYGDYQGNGIGGAFVTESMHRAKDAGAKEVLIPEAMSDNSFNGVATWINLGFHGQIYKDTRDVHDFFDADEIRANLTPEQIKQDYGTGDGEIYAELSFDLADLPPRQQAVAAALTADEWDAIISEWIEPGSSQAVTSSLVELACRDKSCAPPPVGKGGSSPDGRPVVKDEASANALTSRLFEMDLPHGCTTKVQRVFYSPPVVPGSDHFMVKGHIYGPDKKVVGRFERFVHLDENGHLKAVDHDVLSLNPGYQGKGIGGAFVTESMHRAKEAGAEKVRIPEAVSDDYHNGVAVWISLGFDGVIDGTSRRLGTKQAKTIRKRMSRDEIMAQYGKGSQAVSARMEFDLANLPDRDAAVAAALTSSEWDSIIAEWVEQSDDEQAMTSALLELACHDKSCAPPPVGNGGSSPSAAGVVAWGSYPVVPGIRQAQLVQDLRDMKVPAAPEGAVVWDGSSPLAVKVPEAAVRLARADVSTAVKRNQVLPDLAATTEASLAALKAAGVTHVVVYRGALDDGSQKPFERGNSAEWGKYAEQTVASSGITSWTTDPAAALRYPEPQPGVRRKVFKALVPIEQVVSLDVMGQVSTGVASANKGRLKPVNGMVTVQATGREVLVANSPKVIERVTGKKADAPSSAEAPAEEKPKGRLRRMLGFSADAIELACHDKSCAPPPVGTGGSSGGSGKIPYTVVDTFVQFSEYGSRPMSADESETALRAAKVDVPKGAKVFDGSASITMDVPVQLRTVHREDLSKVVKAVKAGKDWQEVTVRASDNAYRAEVADRQANNDDTVDPTYGTTTTARVVGDVTKFTQDQLKAAGITHVILYRGVGSGLGEGGSPFSGRSTGTSYLTPGITTSGTTSWTTDVKMAAQFGRTIVKAVVPVEHILSFDIVGNQTAKPDKVSDIGIGNSHDPVDRFAATGREVIVADDASVVSRLVAGSSVTASLVELACHSKDCAPPPVGRGGSSPSRVTSQASAVAVAKSIYEMDDLPGGAVAKVRNVNYTPNDRVVMFVDGRRAGVIDGGKAVVDGEIYAADGKYVGSFSRAMMLDGKGRITRVHHSSLFIGSAYQGKGIGGAFVTRSMQNAKDAGAEQVTMLAVSNKNDNGVAVWVRMGFDGKVMAPERGQPTRTAAQIRRTMSKDEIMKVYGKGGEAISAELSFDLADIPSTETAIAAALDLGMFQRALRGELTEYLEPTQEQVVAAGTIELACHDKSCAPPPVGRGGSSPAGAMAWDGKTVRTTHNYGRGGDPWLDETPVLPRQLLEWAAKGANLHGLPSRRATPGIGAQKVAEAAQRILDGSNDPADHSEVWYSLTQTGTSRKALSRALHDGPTPEEQALYRIVHEHYLRTAERLLPANGDMQPVTRYNTNPGAGPFDASTQMSNIIRTRPDQPGTRTTSWYAASTLRGHPIKQVGNPDWRNEWEGDVSKSQVLGRFGDQPGEVIVAESPAIIDRLLGRPLQAALATFAWLENF